MDVKDKKNKKKRETGRWTKQEHSRFILGLVNYGKNWKKVEELVGTRTGAQVRSHAQKFFNRLSKVKQNFYEQSQAEQDAAIKAALSNPEILGETSELCHKAHLDPPKPHQQETFYEEESSTPEESEIKISPRISELIKQESEDGTKPIEYKKFLEVIDSEAYKLEDTITKKKTSDQFKEQVKQQVHNMIITMQNQRSQLKNVANLLIAYIVLYGQQLKHEDQSFFEKLVKANNKFICYNRFFNLIDFPQIVPRQEGQNEKPKERRKSFTLCQYSDQYKDQIHNVGKMRKPNPQQVIIIPTVIREVPKKQQQEIPRDLEPSQSPLQLPSN